MSKPVYPLAWLYSCICTTWRTKSIYYFALSGSVVVDFIVTGQATEVDAILLQIEDDIMAGLTLTFPGGNTKTFAEYLAIDNTVMVDNVVSDQ